jgi:hypothetical protein
LLGQKSAIEKAAFIIDLTLFRHLPHFAKKYVHNDYAWLVSNIFVDSSFRMLDSRKGWSGIAVTGGKLDSHKGRSDIAFTERMAAKARADCPDPVFKYIHFWLPHPPIRFDENLNYTKKAVNRSDFKRQARGSLLLPAMLFETLKKLGIYDKTMVFVLADHGQGLKAKGDAADLGSDAASDISWNLTETQAYALPLFLVKPFAATGELQVSDAPVSLSDVAKTIVSELGLDADIPGTSVFDIAESDIRQRRFMSYKNKGGPPGYLPPMREYVVEGFSWSAKSWKRKELPGKLPGT